jgi:hypothetical protein
MDPGFTGMRPRVQLWHGSADTTIRPENEAQSVLEWTAVLGLGMTPTTSSSNVALGGHTWTHNSWTSSCGYTVLDEWIEANGPHMTDSPENATYVVPFLGLDQTGPTDPEVARCAVQAPDDGEGSRDAGSEQDAGGSSREDAGWSTAPEGGEPDAGGEALEAGTVTPDSGSTVHTVDSGAANSGREPSERGPSPPGCGCRIPPRREGGGTVVLSGVTLLGILLGARRWGRGRRR